jgi:hypothetical protein
VARDGDLDMYIRVYLLSKVEVEKVILSFGVK